MYDAIIVGGSYAGLSAALQLARARRRVLVVDAGRRRNRFAGTSHGFLTQDGRAPGDIAADARAQLMAYPTVEWADGEATLADKGGSGFAIAVGASRHEAKRLVLATGVRDTLPVIPGLAERWGRSVFHCPYCHGYELEQGDIGVLGVSPLSMHHALMLPDWGRTTFFLNGAFEPDAEQMAQVQARRVRIERQPIREMAGERADVTLTDGRIVRLDGLFTVTRTSPSSPLAEQLGCAFDETPLGPVVTTDATKATTVVGVFACGDLARAGGSVALSVGDGVVAGVATHRSLMFGT